MKRLVGFAIFAVIGWYIWKNWISQFGDNDPSKQAVKEVEAKNEIGDNKRAVQLANAVPVATFGDGGFAGIPLTIFTAPILKQKKPLTLLHKGPTSNPFDRAIEAPE